MVPFRENGMAAYSQVKIKEEDILLITKHLNKKIQCISDHINSFPTLDTHYTCTRKGTNRKFLEQHLNIRRMYSMYIKSHPEDQHVSEKVYRDIFNTKFNLSFHVPKKDQCLICTHLIKRQKQCHPKLKMN